MEDSVFNHIMWVSGGLLLGIGVAGFVFVYLLRHPELWWPHS
jgi:hypothetical protein